MSEEKETSAQDTPKAEEEILNSQSENKAEVSAEEKLYQSKDESKVEAKEEEISKEEEAKEETEASESEVPEKYDLSLSEDSPLDKSAIERIAAEAKEQGLSNQDAQELLSKEESVVTAYASAQKELLGKTVNAWVDELKVDKEFGGDSFVKNSEFAKRASTAWCSKAFLNLLDDTGLGNHPELVKTFAKIGKAMAEDHLVIPGQQVAQKKSIESLLYPTTKE